MITNIIKEDNGKYNNKMLQIFLLQSQAGKIMMIDKENTTANF